MDEARAVLERLERIASLEARGAPPAVLLDEVRGLLADAEAWVRVERAGTDLAESALERCREALRDAGQGEGDTLKSAPVAVPWLAQDSGNVARKRPDDGPRAGTSAA